MTRSEAIALSAAIVSTGHQRSSLGARCLAQRYGRASASFELDPTPEHERAEAELRRELAGLVGVPGRPIEPKTALNPVTEGGS